MSPATVASPSRLPQCLALLALFWAGLYLPGLGNEELKGEEPRRVLPGLEMLRSGDWMHPVVAGEAYHRKPPLTNWLAALGVLGRGAVDELAVRLPGTLLVLAAALGCCVAVARVADIEAGFTAGIVFLTNLSMLDKGRLAEIEGGYVALTALAFAAWFAYAAPRLAVTSPQPRPWLGWSITGLLLGLAVLAKGPPHLLMFYAVLCGVWWKTGRWRDALHPAHAVGIVLAALVALPWFWATSGSARADGDGSGRDFFHELSSRMDPSVIDLPSWLLQWVQGIANFLPWVLVLLVCVVPPWRRRCGWAEMPRLAVGLLVGLVLGYVLIAATPAARARFTMPLLGPAAVTVAVLLFVSDPNAVLVRWLRRALLAVAVLVGLAAVAGPWMVQTTRGMGGTAMASMLALAVLSLAWVIADWRAKDTAVLAAAFALVMTAGMTVYVGSGQRIKAQSEKLRPTGLAVRELLRPGEQAMLYRAGLQPWVFYAWGRVREVPDARSLPEQWHGPVLLPASRWENERRRLEKRYGSAMATTVIPNPWNDKDLLLIRFAGAAVR